MFRSLVVLVLLCFAGAIPPFSVFAQQTGSNDAVRVTVSQNNDGSRTTYEVNPAERKATSTTVSMQGRLMSKIRYVLDDVGRYQSGEVLDAKEQLLFRTLYKYNAAGQLWEEHRLDKNDALLMKIVYSYNEQGRPAGYAVYDPAGRLLGQTRASGAPAQPAAAAPPAQKSRR